MEGYTQTVLACPERKDGYSAEGEAGDCFRACLLTILEVPKWYVTQCNIPNFANETGWWAKVREWVQNYTLNYTELNWDLVYVNPPSWPSYSSGVIQPIQRKIIVAGKSPRGDWHHAVVADHISGEILWDPHPSRAGIEGDILDQICLVAPY